MKPNKQQRQILTKDLRTRTTNKIKECLAIAAKAYPEHKFDDMPTVLWDLKNYTVGMAYGLTWHLRLNLILAYENEDKFINEDVPHEVGHLIAFRVYGMTKKVGDKIVKRRSHGPEWKSVMKTLGSCDSNKHKHDVSSIEKAPRKPRAPKGSKVTGIEAVRMIKRLQTGFARLTRKDRAKFMALCEDLE